MFLSIRLRIKCNNLMQTTTKKSQTDFKCSYKFWISHWSLNLLAHSPIKMNIFKRYHYYNLTCFDQRPFQELVSFRDHPL